MRTDELDYHLPPGRIATQAAEPRDAAKLMVINRATGNVQHRHVRDLPDLLEPGDLLILNQSRVLPAFFTAIRADTGGKVTGLYLNSPAPNTWHVMLESRGSLQSGETITLAEDAHLELTERRGGGEWTARLHSADNTLALLERIGATPLPPYIRKARRDLAQPEISNADLLRYNTVYADAPGSVAAPTAGLHFTPQLLERLPHAFVTLHVGLGTFAPIRTDRVENHPIHSEWIDIPAATIAAVQEAKRVIPVGTTSVRALESLPDPALDNDYVTDTNLFITDESFPFRFTDALMTNFHLPRSTLLALVAALPGVGIERLKTWYQGAIDNDYRFYSYGDAMLLL